MIFSDNGERNTLISQDVLNSYPNLLVIKSISKSYGVPGLRLGICASSDINLLSNIEKYLPVWNINSFAEYFLQIFGKYAPSYTSSCKSISIARAHLLKQLNSIYYLTAYPSQANYIMCKVHPSVGSTFLAEFLVEKNILIKDLKGKCCFKGKDYVRLAVRNKEDNDSLIKALSAVKLS